MLNLMLEKHPYLQILLIQEKGCAHLCLVQYSDCHCLWHQLTVNTIMVLIFDEIQHEVSNLLAEVVITMIVLVYPDK